MDPVIPEDNEQAGANPDESLVEIHEASIDDLDAALANAQAEEKGEAPASPDSEATPDGEAQPDAANVTPGQPVSKDAGVAIPGASPAQAATQNDAQGLQAENERLKKQGDQKELFIQHRGNELGKLKADYAETRRQLAAAKAQLENGLQDRFAEDPVQASNDRDKIKEISQQLDGLDGQEERAVRIVEAQTFFLRNVDTEKVGLEDVVAVLKADGIDDRYIAEFKANPWEWTAPEALVQIGKRAMDRKEFLTADSDRRILAKHVLAQNEEIKRLKTRPGQVMNQVQKNLNQGPNVTAASSASKGGNSLDPTAIPLMSDKELDSALQNAMRH